MRELNPLIGMLIGAAIGRYCARRELPLWIALVTAIIAVGLLFCLETALGIFPFKEQ